MTPSVLKKFPRNVVIIAPHASFQVPSPYFERLSDEMKSHRCRLLRNFSDHGTENLIPAGIDKSQRVVAWFSRALGDPSRERDAEDVFRDVDFGEIPIWKNPLSMEEKEALLSENWDKFHEQVERAIQRAERRKGRVIVFDLHDTGNVIMSPDPGSDKLRDPRFPEICLSDRNGKSCSPEVMKDFIEAVRKYLKIDPKINDPYQGRYITEHYGEKRTGQTSAEERMKTNVIQVEVGRYLYMDEATQVIKWSEVKRIKAGLRSAMKEVGQKYAAEMLE